MGKFIKMFKALPPEVRLMLAMLGLGTPVGAIYFLRRFFPTTPLWLIILYIVLGVLVIGLLVFIVARIFGRGARKRSKKMADELASDASGPTKVDAAAAIKANNEKFFNAVKQMRKEAHISVYDLPWYIVIGDSGCGKTFLVNNAGLTFSLGKPEGYKLGTLNYNWWFTEDAVFVDMAGRLCNPQDDGDRREWEAFLNTVGKGRRGYPINGAVVCVSMEHLLNDPPEKHESDAVIALERLRDLQSKLGVTFATYVVVTKSDRLVGFLQYFDRPDKGAIKNQMFGWSRPGEFNEMHDPDKFDDVFDSMYARLHELRLRRLNDEADEIDLGLAYAFPEEFRRLHEPLQVYVRTLFPMLRNPRAVKNLLFRGLYFTSATQDDMIPPGTVERYGAEGADQLAKLQALFPKTAYFIKDVLFRKVFPEHGLVFRNEQQVVRHRKLANILRFGTIGLAIALTVGFIFAFSSFRKLILDPREHATMVADEFVSLNSDKKLEEAEKFSGHVNELSNNMMAARFLSVGWGADEPIERLSSIRAKLVESAIVSSLAEVDGVLRSGIDYASGDRAAGDRYLKAVKAYLSWYGCRNATDATGLDATSFDDMWSIVAEPHSVSDTEKLSEQVTWYFGAVGKDDYLPKNPARLIKRIPSDSHETILIALGHAYGYFRDYYASLNTKQHADPQMREWIRILHACRAAVENYDSMMDMAGDMRQIGTSRQLQAFATGFVEKYGLFADALDGTTWGHGLQGEGPDITSMVQVILALHKRWNDYEEELKAIVAKATCKISDTDILASIASFSEENESLARRGLDCEFLRNLKEWEIIPEHVNCLPNLFIEENLKDVVREIFNVFPEIIQFIPPADKFGKGKLVLREEAKTVRDRLREVTDGLRMNLTVPEDLSGETAAKWDEELVDHLDTVREREGRRVAKVEVPEFWYPERLNSLLGGYQRLMAHGRGTVLLATIRARLAELEPAEWGFAELIPFEERTAPRRSAYTIQVRRPDTRDERRREEPKADTATPEREEPRRSSWRDRRARRSRGNDESVEDSAEPRDSGRRRRDRDAPSDTTPPADDSGSMGDGKGRIPACASYEFLNDRAEELALVLDDLGGMEEERAYLTLPDANEDLVGLCRRGLTDTGRTYMKAYVRAWNAAYQDIQLEEFNSLRQRAKTWDELARELDSRGGGGTLADNIASEFEAALSDVLQAMPFATVHPKEGPWDGHSDWPAWNVVAGLMNEAQRSEWKHDRLGAADLTRRVDARASGGRPWEVVAGDFADAFERLCNGIRNNANLPNSFEDESAFRGTSIPWGELAKLRDRYGFSEREKLTASLVDFENTVQNLLSGEVTRILESIQRRYFGNSLPDGGWPYLSGQRYTDSGLNAVDFDQFKRFLVEVYRAEEAFRELESRLTDSAPGRSERRRFIAQCKLWYDFLGLQNKLPPSEEILGVAVRAGVGQEDATAEMFGQRLDDTAQQTATAMVLDLGLDILSGSGRSGDGALQIKTLTEVKVVNQDAQWKWPGVEGRELSVRLEGVLPNKQLPDGPRMRLGMSSPLALCVYLHRYGRTQDEGKTWVVLHGFRRVADVGGGQQQVGERLIFTLGRRMPQPIPRLGG